MRQTEGINQARKDKHLNWEERIQIETLQREGCSGKDIAGRIGRLARTINRELARGWVTHRTGQYSAEERQKRKRGTGSGILENHYFFSCRPRHTNTLNS